MNHPGAEPSPPLSLNRYERLINEGIATADDRGGAVDHLAARRLAIWLAARPQEPGFSRGLVHFTKTGAISQDLKTGLRTHARDPRYPDQPQTARLLQYCVSRGDNRGPIGTSFGRTCDEIDKADVILDDLRDRVRQGIIAPQWPETEGPPVVAKANRDPKNNTIKLVMDPATANAAMYAITAHAGEREAHIREVEQFGRKLPEDSYGRRNREAIATRESRVALRLRALERAYRAAIDRDAAVTSSGPSTRPVERVADRDMELE